MWEISVGDASESGGEESRVSIHIEWLSLENSTLQVRMSLKLLDIIESENLFLEIKVSSIQILQVLPFYFKRELFMFLDSPVLYLIH